jgi:hypothetical protein
VDLSLNAREFPFSRDQKRLVFSGALIGKFAIATHDQPLSES